LNPLNIEYALASPSLRVPRPTVNMATMALTITNTAPNSTLRGRGDGASGQRRPHDAKKGKKPKQSIDGPSEAPARDTHLIAQYHATHHAASVASVRFFVLIAA